MENERREAFNSAMNSPHWPENSLKADSHPFRESAKALDPSLCLRIGMMAYLFLIAVLEVLDPLSWDAVIPSVMNFYRIDETQAGLVGSIRLVGNLLSVVCTGFLTKRVNYFHMIYAGVVINIFALAFSALSESYEAILCSRFLDGMSSAPFVLVRALIQKIAPEGKASLWQGITIIAFVFGSVFGTILGPSVVNATGSIRWIFVYEIIYCLPLLVIPHLKWELFSSIGSIESSTGQNDDSSSREIIKSSVDMMKNKIFLCLAIGGAAVNFSVVGTTYWGIQYMEVAYDLSNQQAALYKSSVSGPIGLFAPIVGGLLIDRSLSRIPREDRWRRSSCIFKWMAILGTCVYVVMIPAMETQQLGLFLLGLACVDVSFMIMYPMSVVLNFEAFRKEDQGLALTLGSVFTLMFGQIPSPTIIGAIADSTSIQVAFMSSFYVCITCTVWFSLGYLYCYSDGQSFSKGFSRLCGKPLPDHEEMLLEVSGRFNHSASQTLYSPVITSFLDLKPPRRVQMFRD